MNKVEKHKPVISENENRSFEYLKDQIDFTIASCVQSSKKRLDQAYQIRNGEMPMEEYEYLKAADGVELPSEVRHVPVLKSMFDVLQGDESLQPVPWRITCNDMASIEAMMEERHAEFMKDLDRMIGQEVMRMVTEVNRSKKDLHPIRTMASQTDFAKRQEDYKSYQTYLEIYSQKVMESEYEATTMKHKFGIMFNDLITTGEEYYQSKVVGINRPPMFRELNPKGLYYTKSHNTHFIAECDRAVYIEEIPAVEVFARWGHKFTAEERKEFFDTYGKGVSEHTDRLVFSTDGNVEGSVTSYARKNISSDLVKVYWTEWKENTKIRSEAIDDRIVKGKSRQIKETEIRYRLDRYEGVRIGEKIYVDAGMSEFQVRNSREPWNVGLTFNGACYNDRNEKPFSLVLATKSLAMKIDIMHYFLENMVAVSGTKVIPVSFPDIPTWLDEKDPLNRVKMWLGHMKQGAMLLDYSQDGAGKFQNYSAYDLSISQSVKVISEIIVMLEETAARITGVGRHRMGNLLQKDGKGVTENAIEQSSIVTQPILQVHNTVMKMAMTDHLNNCRLAYPDGYPGLYTTGKYGKAVFTKGKDLFSLADFNVHVSDSSQTIRDIEEVKTLGFELAQAVGGDVSFLFDMIGNKSLTHVKELAKKAFESGKEQELQKLTSQLEEANSQLQQYHAELERLKQFESSTKAEDLKLRAKELDSRIQLDREKLNSEKHFKTEELKNDAKRVQLEHLQLAYEPDSREIKDN